MPANVVAIENDLAVVKSPRLYSIDLVRGLVIVLMVLDHVKGFMAHMPFDFVDLTRTTPVHFFTRWITHFCAPVFMFLAGTGAFLHGARGRTKTELAWFLFSRGLWLVILELTVIRYLWLLNVDYVHAFGGVLWAIGWAMVALAGLIFLPVSAITVFGVAMIAFHNLADGVSSGDWEEYRWIWCILHTGEVFYPFDQHSFHPFYPLVPWVGVMAVGYSFGTLMLLEPSKRQHEVLGLGIALTLLFVVLRFANVYGDKATSQPGSPGPWSVQDDWLFTVMSFLNCQKYPPSLDFLLMTLGPALILLSLVEREPGSVGRFFIVFGRVPLFFYLAHWIVIRGMSLGVAYLRFGDVAWMFGQGERPSEDGLGLVMIYVLWIGVVVFLYPICWWFARVKQRSRSVWLSYL